MTTLSHYRYSVTPPLGGGTAIPGRAYIYPFSLVSRVRGKTEIGYSGHLHEIVLIGDAIKRRTMVNSLS